MVTTKGVVGTLSCQYIRIVYNIIKTESRMLVIVVGIREDDEI